jgi:hypothetical protein
VGRWLLLLGGVGVAAPSLSGFFPDRTAGHWNQDRKWFEINAFENNKQIFCLKKTYPPDGE